MTNPTTCHDNRADTPLVTILALFAAAMIVFGFIATPADEIFSGLLRIIVEPDSLITDYIALASLGAAFVNAGIVMLISIVLLKICRMPFTGISVACCFQMAGFALFGKNPFNILPILLGVFLYSRYTKEPMGKYIYIALFSTALSPMITEMGKLLGEQSFLMVFSALFTGIVIGFVIVPVTASAARTHMGYNLYNMGFSAGLVCLLLVSLLRGLGMEFALNTVWSRGNNLSLSVFLFSVFIFVTASGFLLDGRSFRGYLAVMRHSGRAIADFVLLDGAGVALINIGVMGTLATLFILSLGQEINGPAIGGIFTVAGFSAFGKHPKNTVWPVVGVLLCSVAMRLGLNQPAVLLAALFSTGLSPIAGQFGPLCGIIAGVFHCALTLDIGGIVGGLNLYNHGFAAGIACLVLIPLFEAYTRREIN
jgi:hypothetical protein